MMTTSMLGKQATAYIASVGESVAVHDTVLNESMLGMVTTDGDVMLARIPNEDEYAHTPQSPVWEGVREDRLYLVWTGHPADIGMSDAHTNSSDALRARRRKWVRDHVNRQFGARFDSASNAELLDNDAVIDAILDGHAEWVSSQARSIDGGDDQ